MHRFYSKNCALVKKRKHKLALRSVIFCKNLGTLPKINFDSKLKCKYSSITYINLQLINKHLCDGLISLMSLFALFRQPKNRVQS